VASDDNANEQDAPQDANAAVAARSSVTAAAGVAASMAAAAGIAAAAGTEPAGQNASTESSQEPVAGKVAPRTMWDAPARRDAGSDSQSEDDDLDDVLDEIPEDEGPVKPLEFVEEPEEVAADREWYILKVQVNREDSIREALLRRVKIAKMDRFFGDIIVPTEEVAEFNKNGKRRTVKKKLYPGYLLVHMALNDETWFVVRETGGIGDFTGSAGKPSIMPTHEVEKILRAMKPLDGAAGQVKTAIPFKISDRVRVKEGYFLNFEGDISAIDQAHGRVTVMINIFGRPNPVELDHWQIEAV
jgi:transcriptional antiterminator NusG